MDMDMEDCMLILIQFLIPLTSCEIACGKNRLNFFGKVLPELHGWSFIDRIFGWFFKGYFGKLFEGQVKLCKKGNCKIRPKVVRARASTRWVGFAKG